jgi:hypothetical protein
MRGWPLSQAVHELYLGIREVFVTALLPSAHRCSMYTPRRIRAYKDTRETH